MKYLTLIYNDAFARFFCSIEDETRKLDSDAQFHHLAIFPSGWLYMKNRARNVSLLPWSVRTRGQKASATSREELDRLATYHYRIAELSRRKVRDFTYVEIAGKYASALNQTVTYFQPDVVLFSGDSRLPAETLKHVLAQTRSPAKRFFFEQGPAGTTLLDTSGVNANASFRYRLASATGDTSVQPISPRRPRYSRNILYPGVDHIARTVLKALRLTPIEWTTVRLPRLSRRDYVGLTRKNYSESPVSNGLLVALQVPDDANNIHHNPDNIDEVELLRRAVTAAEQQENSWHIIAREHPLYRRKYSPEFYALVASLENVRLSSESLEMDLHDTRTVVTVNSTTGLDAYFRGKQVIVFGNAYYDHLPGIIRTPDTSRLRDALANVATLGEDQDLLQLRDRLMSELIRRHFIEGHYLDEDLLASTEIARRISTSQPHSERTSVDL